MAQSNDTTKQLSRRRLLGLIGTAGVAAGVTAIVGCGNDEQPSGTSSGTATRAGAASRTATTTAAASTSSNTPAAVACVLTPAETEGPYFVDEMLNRSDITTDPTNGSVKEGVPLRLTLTVSRVDGSACTPVVGAMVDMWHCDALGTYSDVSGAGQSNTKGQKFLRGFQVTDDSGKVEFKTIFPGFYRGRTVHIHFKVRTDANSQFEFTSQLFFDETVRDAVFAQAPYSQNGSPDTSNATDNIFDPDLIVDLTPEGGGYAGRFDVGVQLA